MPLTREQQNEAAAAELREMGVPESAIVDLQRRWNGWDGYGMPEGVEPAWQSFDADFSEEE